MRSKVKEYFMIMSASSDVFGGLYPAEKITAGGVFTGILVLPIVLLVNILRFPFELIAKLLNKSL